MLKPLKFSFNELDELLDSTWMLQIILVKLSWNQPAINL